MPLLKLIALDPEDLAVISANVQDAILKAGDIVFEARAKRFVAAINRFDWEQAHATQVSGQPAGKSSGKGRAAAGLHERRRSVLRFEKVRKVQSQNLKQGEADRVLSLLALTFEPTVPPAGFLTLVFADNAAIRLEVDYIEAELRDLGPTWKTRRRPDHGEAAGPDESS